MYCRQIVNSVPLLTLNCLVASWTSDNVIVLGTAFDARKFTFTSASSLPSVN